MRFAFNKEINERNVQYAIEKDKEEELLMKMKDMEIEFNKFKKEEEIIKLNEIELNSQIKRLKCISEEKNERIRMLNEELEYFMYHFQKEKKEHGYTSSALQALEKKVLKEKKEKEEKELKEKEEKEKELKEKEEKEEKEKE